MLCRFKSHEHQWSWHSDSSVALHHERVGCWQPVDWKRGHVDMGRAKPRQLLLQNWGLTCRFLLGTSKENNVSYDGHAEFLYDGTFIVLIVSFVKTSKYAIWLIMKTNGTTRRLPFHSRRYKCLIVSHLCIQCINRFYILTIECLICSTMGTM